MSERYERWIDQDHSLICAEMSIKKVMNFEVNFGEWQLILFLLLKVFNLARDSFIPPTDIFHAVKTNNRTWFPSLPHNHEMLIISSLLKLILIL